MDNVKRDLKINILRHKIEERKDFLIEKQNHLKQVSKENVFLMDVVNDYIKHYSIIKKQKMQQREALESLSRYMNEMNLKIQHSDELLSHSKAQQQKITDQIKRVGEEIDRIN
jgi:hypothetical protein